MRRKKSNITNNLTKIFIVSIFCITISSAAYGHWINELLIVGKVETGKWKASIKIRKTLSGAYTDPETGEDLTTPTNLIAIAAEFPTKFELTICVKNCDGTTLTDVVVTDTIKNTVAPREWTPSQGTVAWNNHAPGNNTLDPDHYQFNDLKWVVGTLDPHETACLVIVIETLQNPSDKYEPTSGDEGDGQDIEINDGATVTATSSFGILTATTQGITINIADNGNPEDGIGIIESPELPYSTPWAKDEKSRS